VTGDFDEAVKWQKQSIQGIPEKDRSKSTEILGLYERKSVYLEIGGNRFLSDVPDSPRKVNGAPN